MAKVKVVFLLSDSQQRQAFLDDFHAYFRLRARFVLIELSHDLSTVEFCQLVPDFAFAFGQFLRHVDLNFDIKIATLSRDTR